MKAASVIMNIKPLHFCICLLKLQKRFVLKTLNNLNNLAFQSFGFERT